MPGKLRLLCLAEVLLLEFPAVSTVPLGTREENPGSLDRVISEAVGRDRELLAHSGISEDGDGGGKEVNYHTGNAAPVPEGDALSARQGSPSTAAKNLMIAGGTIVVFAIVAAIAFWMYKARGGIFWRPNLKQKRGGASEEGAQSAVFGGVGEKSRYSIPDMPPPPLATPASIHTPDEKRTHESTPEHIPLAPPPAYLPLPLHSPSTSSSISQNPPRGLYPPPPPIPSSPSPSPQQTPSIISHFSWTATTAKSVRSSIDSEPRFHRVNSWASNQATHLECLERSGDGQLLGTSPDMPRAFRHHPGAPVSFLRHAARKESADLDKQLSVVR